MSSTAPTQTGRTLPRAFGRYALFDLIGVGGMAEIYLARARTDLGAARLVVVKQILPEFADNDRFGEMLIAEAKLASRLNHANVVHVLDLGREARSLFIAMEYVEGFDLNQLLGRCARQKVALPIEFALLIVVEVLRGLDYAHRRTGDEGRPLGIVHRDVSPSNVLVSFDGEVKLCDFGIAHANDLAPGSLVGEAVRGKAGYMSPEHARGETLDARADVFAAAVLLWEMLAGHKRYKPAEGESAIELAARAPYAEPPPRDLPDEAKLHQIVRRALAPARDARYVSARAFLDDLEGYAVATGQLASPLRLGAWVRDNFGGELLEQRRARERAARALESGPPVVLSTFGRSTDEERAPPGAQPEGLALDHVVEGSPRSDPPAPSSRPVDLPARGAPSFDATPFLSLADEPPSVDTGRASLRVAEPRSAFARVRPADEAGRDAADAGDAAPSTRDRVRAGGVVAAANVATAAGPNPAAMSRTPSSAPLAGRLSTPSGITRPLVWAILGLLVLIAFAAGVVGFFARGAGR